MPEGFDDDRGQESESLGEAQGLLHDIANALTVIIGWADEASQEPLDQATVTHALRMIARCGASARSLARRAIGAHEANAHAQAGKIIDDALEPLSLQATRSKVWLLRKGTSTAEVLFTDELGLIVTNLVLNALAFAPKGSAITVACDEAEGAIHIAVSDEGPGIPPERVESIFRGDSRRPGGTGIGLAHSRKVARRRGGDLSLQPSAVGAVFALTWPRADADAEPAPLSRVRPQPLAGLRVLMIEDDTTVSEFLRAALEARGASVVGASKVKDLDDIDVAACNVALADLSPFQNDAQLAIDTLRQRSIKLPIVVVSGSVAEVPTTGGAIAWVSKPFETRELIEVVVALALS